MTGRPDPAERHLAAFEAAAGSLRHELPRLRRWGAELADRLSGGGRLLAVGNGGSAAEAQHLTSELVGRYRSDRRPFSALALHADSSAFTAIANDYGVEETFRRQVDAHGRPGDVLVALSTSGRSPNVLAAVRAARRIGMVTWAVTGPAPNPLAGEADDALGIPVPDAAVVQELHLVAVHLLCEVFEQAVSHFEQAGSDFEQAGSAHEPTRSDRTLATRSIRALEGARR